MSQGDSLGFPTEDPDAVGPQGQVPVAPPTVEYPGMVQQQGAQPIPTAPGGSMPGLLTQIFDEVNSTYSDARASGFASGQARNLMGDGMRTRPGPHIGGHHYPGYSQDELHSMVNTQADPSSVNDQGHSFTNVGNGLVEIADDMSKTTSTANASWQGAAAQGAAAFTTAMGAWHGSTGQGAQLAGNRVWEQSQGLAQARAAMPPPVAAPTAADFAKAITANPIQAVFDPSSVIGPLVDQYHKANDNHAQMARVAQQYDSHLGANSTMPEFTTPANFSPNPPAGPGQPRNPGGAVHGGGTGGSSAPRFVGSGRSGTPSGPRHSGTAPMQEQPLRLPPPNNGGGPTNISWAPPTPGSGNGFPGNGGFLGNPGSGFPGGGPGAGPDLPGFAGIPPIGGGFGSAGAGGGFARGGGVGAGGSGGFGPGGSDSAAGGASAAGGGDANSARSAAGAAAAEESAIQRGAAGAQTPGETSGEPMSAGRGGAKRSQDAEHKRPDYLIEGDPDSVFGTDELVAPPVIGG